MQTPQVFSVGWSRIDITPKEPTPLDGMGNNYGRKENWIWPEKEEDRLKASLIVICDGVDWAHTVVLCPMDTLFIHEPFSNVAAKMIADAIDIPAENVFFCGSHTHCGVAMHEKDPSVIHYIEWLNVALVEAAKDAVADLAPATVAAGSLETVGMNYQRRYILKDGSHRCTVFDKTYVSEDIAGFETTPDHILRAIRLERQGKKDILLVNWQMHPGYASSVQLGRVSADIYGTIREYYEAAEPDCYFAFFQGAAGNMGRTTRWEQAPGYAKSKSFDRDGYGKEFVSLLQSIDYQPMNSGEICVRNDKIAVHRRMEGKVLEEIRHLTLNTITFGQVAFATAPAEIFSDTGLAVRKGSPYAMTFFCSCTNGSYGYLPIKSCFEADPDLISFEVRRSGCQPGTAEMISECLIKMLNIL